MEQSSNFTSCQYNDSIFEGKTENKMVRDRRDDEPRSSRGRSPRPHVRKSDRNEHDTDRRRRPERSDRPRYDAVRENPKPSRCLGVFGLSQYTTEEEIYQMMNRYGSVESVQMVIDSKSGRSRGFCFVYFTELRDAEVAKEKCSGVEIEGKKIRVDFSLTERPHTPTPGVYMGNRSSYERNYRSRQSHHRRRGHERSRSRSYSPRK
ncbi:transformer-2 sex-determining protein isoform X3 [Aethina tumida]|uniref:transformer-2 sex-determining protein isoform X3 n=1 Tax=Aethina tumida TaxID=116153 RepID=UPI0021475694|nr:transformer-2 sex-determining protein isoform X3 [Aethina tumida]